MSVMGNFHHLHRSL